MRFTFRRRRPFTVAEPPGLPALRSERAMITLAVHANQLDDRLARVEHRLQELTASDAGLEDPTHDDLLDVRLHSARVAAELARVAVELQARIDDIAVQMPAVLAEDRRQQRARTLAHSIVELSDSLDTTPVDVDGQPGRWAATA